MIDINKHKFFLVQLLRDIYSDIELSTSLGFKGGTAHMFFYDLPRFSVDLDFNLLSLSKSDKVYNDIKTIVKKYGHIKDEAKKHYGHVIVLNYGEAERNLKIEISNRLFPDNYEIKNYLGISIQVMKKSDMFAHKLCALTERKIFANRDVFDVYFYMKQQTPINKQLVELRMNKSFNDYLEVCIQLISSKKNSFLNGLGELVTEEMKHFVKNKLQEETIQLLHTYSKYPLTSKNNN